MAAGDGGKKWYWLLVVRRTTSMPTSTPGGWTRLSPRQWSVSWNWRVCTQVYGWWTWPPEPVRWPDLLCAAERRWSAWTSRSRWAVAREFSSGIDFRAADAHELPLSNGEFDVVTFAPALSHFQEPRKALGEVLRVLRRGGRLAASA